MEPIQHQFSGPLWIAPSRILGQQFLAVLGQQRSREQLGLQGHQLHNLIPQPALQALGELAGRLQMDAVRIDGGGKIENPVRPV